jgi:hypothetical protein
MKNLEGTEAPPAPLPPAEFLSGTQLHNKEMTLAFTGTNRADLRGMI